MLATLSLSRRWAALGGAVAGLLVAAWAGPVPGGLAALIGWTLACCRWLLGRERAADRDRAALAVAVAGLAAEYSAGSTTGSAFSLSAPAAGRFGPALA
ncbi:MAG: hypothetical protein M3Y89_16985, partial [Actinomycetota bacterium]|nr:hypothetical protein [Actinomycetota bacterium]